MKLDIVATCPVGLEEFVERELLALGVPDLYRSRGSVAWQGDWRSVYRANLWLRCANRVLVQLGQWGVGSDDDLTRGAEKLTRALLRGRVERLGGLDGRELFDPLRSLAVQASSARSRITDSRWVAQKVKDGVVDAQRAVLGQRSDVERRAPDTPLRARLFEDRLTLFLDTSVEPLDRRGYRLQAVDAPVREHLAAAFALAAEWDGVGAIADPMCGSGTLLIEAAWLHLGWAPSRLRQQWLFDRLESLRGSGWAAELERSRCVSEPVLGQVGGVELFGLDRSEVAVRATRRNLEAAGLGTEGLAQVEEADAFDYDAPADRGLVLVNPPYGERVSSPGFTWRRLGDLLKRGYGGWTAVVLAGDERLGRDIGLKPRRRIPVRNGALEARILVFDLY